MSLDLLPSDQFCYLVGVDGCGLAAPGAWLVWWSHGVEMLGLVPPPWMFSMVSFGPACLDGQLGPCGGFG